MSSSLLFSLFLQTIQLSFSFSLPIGGNDTDRLSLLAFKDQITNDPLGALSSWNESLHFCKWSGVICGHRHQRVVLELHRNSYQLEGSLSPHIGNLSFVRILSLQNNSLTHGIPPEIGRLFRLRSLSLDNNTFSGDIPANISRCSNLLLLTFEGNNLTGKLPAQLGSLSMLREFIFNSNNLVGEITTSFGNLSSILLISGLMNHLQGGIPNSIGQLRKLEGIYFPLNNLSGIIPPYIYYLSSLTSICFEVNQLHGSLPAILGKTLPNLEIFTTGGNQFTGLIPMTLSNASDLSEVALSYNFFTGKIPSLASLPNLRIMAVDVNHLGNGDDDDLSFLYDLANNSNLEALGINDNNVGGVLPAEIVGNFSSKLWIMTAGENLIRGSIPKEVGNIISLENLGLER